MRYLPVERQLPVVGRPHRWALDLAVGGAILPFVTLLSPYGVPLPLLVSLSLTTGAAGGLLGLCTPPVLDKLRGNVPLPLLAVLAATVSSSAMLGAAWLVTGPSDIALLWLVLGAGIGTFLWLPYLVLTALGRPTWPVVALGLVGAGLGKLLTELIPLLLWLL